MGDPLCRTDRCHLCRLMFAVLEVITCVDDGSDWYSSICGRVRRCCKCIHCFEHKKLLICKRWSVMIIPQLLQQLNMSPL